VRSEEVNGVNEYNLGIAQKRVQRLVSGTIDLLTNYTVHTRPYPGVIVCLGGDMVSGDIHEELRETNERPTMPVVVEAVGILHWAIKALADKFGKVFVPCVTGNHGRSSSKPRHANRNWTNFDWLIYQFLSKSFEGDSRVRFLIGEGADVIFSVFGHRYLLTHGDNLAKGGDGQIGHFGPVIRGSQRRQVRNQAVNQEFDTLLCGHFHSLTMTPRFIVNGSLVGPGVFSHNLAFGFEKPQQALWLSHQDKGVTICMPVFLTDGHPYKGKSPDWVSWAAKQ
jgi:predicted phosphodiesterase